MAIQYHYGIHQHHQFYINIICCGNVFAFWDTLYVHVVYLVLCM